MILRVLAAATAVVLLYGQAQAAPKGGTVVWALLRDGAQVEGTASGGPLSLSTAAGKRQMALRDLLSINCGEPAAGAEARRIARALEAVQAKDHAASEAAVADLADIGLPAMTPLLLAYRDTDAHEPNPLYRLFARLVPGYADERERTSDLVRLANGETLRGRVTGGPLKINVSGVAREIPLSAIRRFAVRRNVIQRAFEVQALRHCTPIEFLDTGVRVAPESTVSETAEGFVRLSFDIDGWASDADGIKEPGPNYKTNLVDGYPFGALVGRVGPSGRRWLAGKRCEKGGLGSGRLYLAVNDNAHWQNNLGSFRVKLKATDAYDLGDPQ